MQKSDLFTEAELREYNNFLKGNRKDPTGIFCRRVKPKILELFEWFKKRQELKKVLQPKR